MRRFLTALFCLSTLAVAQIVIAAAPAPGSMILLVVGLSGLAAVGSRSDEPGAQGSPRGNSA